MKKPSSNNLNYELIKCYIAKTEFAKFWNIFQFTKTNSQPWQLGKKYDGNFIFTITVVKVRYSDITIAKIFKHGNYLTQLLLFCFLLLDCFSIEKVSSHSDPSSLWGWKNWQSLAADHPLFRASIVVNLANKQHWYWEWRMVKLIVN